MIFRYSKKIFGSLPIFLAAFVIISLAADISFLQRKTTSSRGEAGWQGMPDFKVFWKAGNVMSSKISGVEASTPGLRPLYDKEEPFYHFRYSPIAAVGMIPLSMIPYPRVAMLFWLLAGNIVFLAAMLILGRYMKKRVLLDDVSRVFMLWCLFLGTLRYYLVVICQGQTDGFVSFLLVLLLLAYIGRKEILVGLLFAVLLQMKPFFLPMGLFFLADRKYKTIVSSVVAMLFFVVLPSVFLGVDETIMLTKDWVCMVRESGLSQVMNYKNQSLAYGAVHLAAKIAGLGKMSQLPESVFFVSGILTVSSLVLFLSLMRCLRRGREWVCVYLTGSVVVAISVLFSPISWEAYYTFLIIPLALIFVLGKIAHREKKMIFYLAGYFLLTLSCGTDITKFIPGINDIRFINVSLGSVFLLYGVFDLYRSIPLSSTVCEDSVPA